MEHSVLHATQLLGMLLALATPVLALLVLLPGIALLGLLLVAGLRRQKGSRDRRTAAASPAQQAS